MPAKRRKKKEDKTEETTIRLRALGSSVYYEKSVTKNLGNFESAKVTVGLTLPINPTEEEQDEIEKTIEIADSLVTEELEIQLKEIVEKK